MNHNTIKAATCPECGDQLIGFSFAEALTHLSSCDHSPGWYIFGVKARKADSLYHEFTGEPVPEMSEVERVRAYWEMAKAGRDEGVEVE